MSQTIRTHRPTAGPDATVSPASASAPSGGLSRVLLRGATPGPRATDLGLLVLRVTAGLTLALLHGMGKLPPADRFVAGVAEMGLPAPGVFAWLSALAEFGCATLLALGLLTRPAAFLICGNMAVVILLAHAGDPFGDREKAVLFGAIALLFLLAGAGRYSLDALIRRRRP